MRTIRLPLLTGLATLALLIATEPGLSIVWDEGYTLGRIERVRLWFSAMATLPGSLISGRLHQLNSFSSKVLHHQTRPRSVRASICSLIRG